MLLLSIFLLPLIGALVLSIVRVYHKFISLIFSILTFFLSILVVSEFYGCSALTTAEYFMGMSIGIDKVSLPFLLLTTFLFVICIIYDCTTNYVNARVYMALFLLLESFIVGFFVSLDAISFYIFFEAVLVPMFFIIGIWGGKDRVYAAFKFFLYTLAGSLLFLLGLIYICNTFGTSNIHVLTALTPTLDFKVQILLWLAFFISFAIKIPMFPFHTWLPDAHVQSPTSGSVILAGILIKMGGYGFLRFSIPMFPAASEYFASLVMVLSIIAVIYASLVAFAQDDIKKLIAYSSIAHMGVVTAGLFSFNEKGTLGAIFHMISHGLISAALFLCVGMLYTRTGTLEIKKYNGIVNIMPKFSFMFVLFSMASIGLPGTSGFIGEFLSMLGIFESIKLATGFIALGTILSALYMLNLCKKMIWGINHSNVLMEDLNAAELLTLTLLAALVIFLGFYPTFVLKL
ncbi:NADH-quinone oxidoreductase subunit M [Wolbachia pipientis]|uniref:NADH-quinone oxidoreductase subunit M n=1 Tax=Wolbachia pipientis TaxID=955 RepID=A0A1E7QJU6_WOLPI|nr:NADH-quinone oxidoreductase subunit M [Wolbachia pipientis]OEY86626.1 NADH-quinone oxidoreductase subunit M [Wolbachia pipientis]